MKSEYEREICGYLTVFTALTLAIMISLCLVLIEGARQNTLRLETECVTDLGMNSILAEYHRKMQERYGLFYIDSSYGTDYPSYYNVEAHLRGYMEKNIALQEELGLLADNEIFQSIYMDPLKMEFPEIKVVGVALATDHEGYFLQKQAIGVMESDMGVDAIRTVISRMQTAESYALTDNVVDERIHELEEELKQIHRKQSLEDGTWVETEVDNPVPEFTVNRREGLLRWVLKDSSKISDKTINTQMYISTRRSNQINQGNMEPGQKLSLTEKILFWEYLCRYTGNYLTVRENCGLDYQLEYLLFGENSDKENLRKTAGAICGLRESANLIFLMGNEERRNKISAAATVLSAALLVPEAEPVFSGLIMVAWSCLESIADTRSLMQGKKVPLLKNEENWMSDLSDLFDGGAGEERSDEEGMDYEEYLQLLLSFADLSRSTYRFMDIVEMDIRRTAGNEAFRIDGCVDCVEAMVTMESKYGYSYSLRHVKGYR